MTPMLRPTLLSCAMAAFLVACSSGTDDPMPTSTEPLAIDAPQEAPVQAPAEPAGPPVVEVEDMGGVEDEIDENLFEDLKVRPVSHEALEATLLVGEEGKGAVITQAYGQSWVSMRAGDPGAICVKNIAAVPALASFSFQGLNVDLRAANPFQDLWRIEPQNTRCFSFIQKDDDRPLIAAWHVFFGYGDDGSQVIDLSAPAAASGFIRLEKPAKTPPPDAWPGMRTPAAQAAAQPETSTTQPEAPPAASPETP